MATERRAKDVLRDLGVRPVKERGQNFLIDGSVLDQIVEFGSPNSNERVIEIGPGLGALTERLAAVVPGKALTLIEIEPQFCLTLSKRFPEVGIINADVREVDLAAIGSDLTIFGNLPYSLSTDITLLLLRNARQLRRAVLLLQRQFAERVAAEPGGREYGALTVACRLWADARLGPIIRGDAFHPPTEVESRLIELRFADAPRCGDIDPAWFERVVRASFAQRRKKVINSIVGSGLAPLARAAAALAAAAIDPSRRAETIALEEFAALARELSSRR